MDGVVFIGLYTLALTLPAVGLTVLLAALVRTRRIGRAEPRSTAAGVGLAVPVVMWLWGFWHPDSRAMDDGVYTDMVPAGPGLMIAAIPAALACLLVSWLMLRRR